MAKEQRVLSITLVKVDDDGAATFSLELGSDITRSIFMDGKRRGRDPGQWIIDAIALGLEVSRMERDSTVNEKIH